LDPGRTQRVLPDAVSSSARDPLHGSGADGRRPERFPITGTL